MSYNIQSFRQFYRQNIIPRYYQGIAHLLFSVICLSAAVIYLLQGSLSMPWYAWLMVPFTFVLGSLVVWWLHKYPLHRPLPGLQFAYKIHTLYHHRFFTDEAVTWDNTRDFHIVFFPPFAVVGFCLLGLPLLYTGFAVLFGESAASIGAATAAAYFLLYETVHFCSHLPATHPLIKHISYLRTMRAHHLIHHQPQLMHKANFNVVCPIWDHWLGTYVSRRDGQ